MRAGWINKGLRATAALFLAATLPGGKVGVRNSAELVRFALREGLLD